MEPRDESADGMVDVKKVTIAVATVVTTLDIACHAAFTPLRKSSLVL